MGLVPLPPEADIADVFPPPRPLGYALVASAPTSTSTSTSTTSTSVTSSTPPSAGRSSGGSPQPGLLILAGVLSSLAVFLLVIGALWRRRVRLASRLKTELMTLSKPLPDRYLQQVCSDAGHERPRRYGFKQDVNPRLRCWAWPSFFNSFLVFPL